MSNVIVDIVIAVRNEEESIPVLLNDLAKLPIPKGVELRTIFVEDSSTDGTRSLLRERSRNGPGVYYLFLERGYGQAVAVALGLSRSNANAMITMDVDGGHPIDLIPGMIAGFLHGAEAVQAVRRSISSRDWRRDIGSTLFKKFFALLTGIQTDRQNVYYRLISQRLAFMLVANYRWRHFLRINYSALPRTKVEYLEFDAAERTLGVSKYPLKRLLAFALIAVISSISFTRFSILSTLLFGAAALLAWGNFYFSAVIVAVLATTLVTAFYRMSARDVFERINIQEEFLPRSEPERRHA